MWVRPEEMFEETVDRDGEIKPRFAKIRPATREEVLAQFEFENQSQDS